MGKLSSTHNFFIVLQYDQVLLHCKSIEKRWWWINSAKKIQYAFPMHEYIIPRRSQTFGASAGPTSEDWFEHFRGIFMQWRRQWYSDICIPTASTPLPQKSACVPWCQAHSLQSWPQRRLSEMVKNEGQEICRYSMGNWKNNLKHLCTCDNLYGIMNNCCRKTVEHMWSLFYTNYFNTK